MANFLYPLTREDFMKGLIAMNSDSIKASLLYGASYTPNPTTDHFYSTVSAAEVAVSPNLSSKTTTNGTFNAAGITFTAVTGSQCDYLCLWKDTGTPSTSPLIALYDTATNLPLTPNGGDVGVQWSTGPDKIFTLNQGLRPEERDALEKIFGRAIKWWDDMLGEPGLILKPRMA